MLREMRARSAATESSRHPRRDAEGDPPRVVAVLGPTNTGKTHLAVERMLGHASGMIGLPLRLLAREVYDRVVKARGASAVALITGEEKLLPPRPHYYVCTAEAMPLERRVEFLALDEAQLAADPERGHIFTDRLLHARGEHETLLLGAATLRPLVRRLLPMAEIVERERFSALTSSGMRKVTRLPKRSAVVAFSAERVYAIAELIRRQRGGAAVVMGSLSPRTRNAQVALYQSGEVDFLVATDAIGMGLNMDVDHVAFAGLSKFDGRRWRELRAAEVAQIAGRAGRYRRDGTFGVTGGADPMPEELISAVEDHRFAALDHALWRNGDLDFAGVPALMSSLSASPPAEGLRASEEALDERTLRQLAADPGFRAETFGRAETLRLWEVCQTPDFRKISPDDHLSLVRGLFGWLNGRGGRVPQDWMAREHGGLDRTDGEIDALSARLAGVRTLAYIAHRPDWLAEPDHWRERTRELEDRLSDALHERLMARFVDRRTSVLMKSLNDRAELLAGVGPEGRVSVEGEFVGRLRGVRFEPASGEGPLEHRALRAAIHKAVTPEVARRLGALARSPDEAFAVLPDGVLTWRGDAAAVLVGADPFKPSCRLLGELGPEAARERAQRRLEAFVAGEAARFLPGLCALDQALASGAVRGLVRGLAFRLWEAGGAIARRGLERELAALSRAERRELKTLGVHFGAFALYLPELRDPPPLARALLTRASCAETARLIPAGPAVPLETSAPADRTLALAGHVRAGDCALSLTALDRLESALRPAPGQPALRLTRATLAELGWTEAQASLIMTALGFQRLRPLGAEGDLLWRRRRAERGQTPPRLAPSSPFAALAPLAAPPAPVAPGRRSRRPPRRRVASARSSP